MNILNEFKWRSMISDFTKGLEEEFLVNKNITGYIGFDPTAKSLHVGSLLPIMALSHFQRFGHNPIAIVGGGTGLIGDPSGKTQERKLLTPEKVEENLQGIKKQLSNFLDFDAKENPAKIINNADWISNIRLIDFLRDIGKFFTVNYMIAKDSVKSRMESDEGITLTEFNYMPLQAYDFLELNDKYNCTLEMGGSDQWGNIVAGIDLIRKIRNKKSHGLVFPLVTTSSGVKFGKTETGTIWLDPELTSPYKFYQFWLNTEDKDVIKYLKFFTFLSEKEIQELENKLTISPDSRDAQKKLAREVTFNLHGKNELAKAEKATKVLFGEEIMGLSSKEVLDVFSDVPSTEISKNSLIQKIKIADLLFLTKIVESKGEAKRLVQSGGIYINNIRISDNDKQVGLNESIEGKFIIIRKGRKEYHLVKVI